MSTDSWESEQKVVAAAAATGASSPRSMFFFSIGSVEQFEEKLDAVHQELGVHYRDHIPVYYTEQSSWTVEALRFLPSILLIAFFAVLMRGAGGMMGGMGGGGGMMQVGKSKAIKAENVTTTFKDVAGCQEAKLEIMEFVDFLHNPETYTRLGAKIPKGALLVGPPGCGKTLLAKATAGESKAPFYSVSGSDFIEMFVGVGPSRVRDLFAQARANSPCLIFIDEIDAVGRARGKGGMAGGGNDERENTLNQLLVEMDGFNTTSGVVVLAGTNRADVLDSALLRPGRFDRQISVDKPDIAGRREIFEVHLAGLTLEETVADYAKKLAAFTPGFSGAQIANVCNEAAIIAARENAKTVAVRHFDSAVDRCIGGLEKKNKVISAEERKVVAYHEAGHAVAGWFLKEADPVMKVTIVPRGQAALGYAQSLPKDLNLHTETQIADMMAMALGGRCAEEIFFGAVSTGAQNDMEKVTNMVYACITQYGMNERVGHLNFGSPDDKNTLYKMYSEKTAAIIDEEASKMVVLQYDRALCLLKERKAEVQQLAECLLEKEVVGPDDLVRILGERLGQQHKDYDEYIKACLTVNKDKESASAEEEDPDVQGPVDDVPLQPTPA